MKKLHQIIQCPCRYCFAHSFLIHSPQVNPHAQFSFCSMNEFGTIQKTNSVCCNKILPGSNIGAARNNFPIDRYKPSRPQTFKTELFSTYTSIKLDISNYIATNSYKNVVLESQFEKDMKDYYHAETASLDFSKSDAVKTINNWCYCYNILLTFLFRSLFHCLLILKNILNTRNSIIAQNPYNQYHNYSLQNLGRLFL